MLAVMAAMMKITVTGCDRDEQERWQQFVSTRFTPILNLYGRSLRSRMLNRLNMTMQFMETKDWSI